MSIYQCFDNNNTELRLAIDDYIFGGTVSRETYGPNISDWCVDNIQDFSYAFGWDDIDSGGDRVWDDSRYFNEPLTHWNTSAATNMSGMFRNVYYFDYPVDHFVVDNVVDFDYMFDTCTQFNQSLEGWNTSSAKSMRAMFRSTSKFLGQELNNFIVDKVTDFSYFVAFNREYNSPLSSWNTSKAKSFSHFVDGTSFDYPLFHFVVDKVTDFSYMLSGTPFNRPIRSWDTSSAINLEYQFAYCSEFNQNLSHFVTDNVEDMSYMFTKAESFNQDISGWSMKSVKRMDGMFRESAAFNQDLCLWGAQLGDRKEGRLPDFTTKSYFKSMFADSGCPITDSPDPSNNPLGPFCHTCFKLRNFTQEGKV